MQSLVIYGEFCMKETGRYYYTFPTPEFEERSKILLPILPKQRPRVLFRTQITDMTAVFKIIVDYDGYGLSRSPSPIPPKFFTVGLSWMLITKVTSVQNFGHKLREV